MILAHSQMPLRLVMISGFAISALALLSGFVIAIAHIYNVIRIPGWASLIVAIFAIGGVQIFMTGVVGIYVGRSLDEAKRRPLYFVRDLRNLPLRGRFESATLPPATMTRLR